MALSQPRGKQLEVLDLKPEGHNVVLGTAGSGKTTLAIYRAIYLATLDDKERVLLVTFNTTLVKYLEAIVGSEIPRNIDVRNYHKFARGYLAHRNKMPRWNGIVSGMEDGDNKKQLFVRRALEKVKAENGTNSTLKRSEEVFLEEINWIEKMGIKTLDEYEKVERVGRFDTRIIRENRKYFFQVYKAYLEVRKEEGYLYDWEDIAQTVYEELDNDTEKRMYKHIIVDEGQDLSPIMLKSLVKAIPEDGTFTFFGDVAQQIYGSRLSWREAGLKIVKNKIWYFDRNYRNSKEIAKFAVTISKSKYFEDKTKYINCSVQYPNWWYLRRVKDNNPIFSDWAILFIDPIVATIETTQFCKVNAATRYGAYIYKGVEAFREMFSEKVGRQNRTIDMLQNAPTDDQAEVLVYESIPVSMIKGIVFENEKIARQKIVEWKVMGFPKIDVFISPELFDVSTSGKIRSGVEPVIRPYREEKNELF